jgi:hypothetical protein
LSAVKPPFGRLCPHKKDLRRLKKRAKRHRATLNGLKADLKKIKSSRVAIVDKS